jgi:hypothetical protein
MCSLIYGHEHFGGISSGQKKKQHGETGTDAGKVEMGPEL